MKQDTCIHYNGLAFARGTCECQAGVDIRATFDGKKAGIFMRMPCVAREDRRGEVEMPCALRQVPTAEQIAQSEKEFDDAFARVKLGLIVALTWRVKPKPLVDRSEIVECPSCKGNLHLSQSSYNGHVHGKCETEGCISWME